MVKSNAERCKEWREKKRAALVKKKEKAKGSAQRALEWRLRKKEDQLRENEWMEDHPLECELEIVENEYVILDNNSSLPIQSIQSNIIHDDSSNAGPSNALQLAFHENCPYPDYYKNGTAHLEFDRKFTNNPFGHACTVCDRLWFKDELTPAPARRKIFDTILPGKNVENIRVCSSCNSALKKNSIPVMSTYNGFKYPKMPDLPPLDLVSERLITPRLPFVQIRRLRHVSRETGYLAQVLNAPVSVNTMVYQLPRNLDDDHCVNVHLISRSIHKSSYLSGLIKKRRIEAWLRYLTNSPLHAMYDITINESFFDGIENISQIHQNHISEHIPIEDMLSGQQFTLLWNEEKYLQIKPGDNCLPISLLFDGYAEELSFPVIYLGRFRDFREEVRVTPFMMASSELRRSDRRGVTQCHLLYVAMKIMRLRVRDSLTIAFNNIGKITAITRGKIESEDYLSNYLENNQPFLRAIPNSPWYRAEQQKDLFAMIRQLGKPTMFLTVNANEIGWTDLLRTLFKLKNNRKFSKESAEKLKLTEKFTLVNEDAVTCAIYFSKLINVLMNILQSKKWSPFGNHRVDHYFKRIEFQHSGSPRAHILLWLANAPIDAIDADREKAVALIDKLMSLSAAEASGNIKLQIHKHTPTCHGRIVAGKLRKCKFGAPFMPSRKTMILTPMQKTDPAFAIYAKRYASLKLNLESYGYSSIDEFYKRNNLRSDAEYTKILRAGIIRTRIFLKREPNEAWHIPFNPFILNVLKTNIDIRFIKDEYACASHVVEYVTKTNRDMSELKSKIVRIIDDHPKFDIFEITKKMSVDMINSVELTSQEAAWYLLREPMSKSSEDIAYIPTVRPGERQQIKRTLRQNDEAQSNEDSMDICRGNWFEKYEKRPKEMETLTLAQFVAHYTQNTHGTYIIRRDRRVIRYRNYDIGTHLKDYKREMVTLYVPFRNEVQEILTNAKFVGIYNQNEELILQRHKEFSSGLDIRKAIEICQELCRRHGTDDNEAGVSDGTKRVPELNAYELLFNNEHLEVELDLRVATLNNLGPNAKRRMKLMSHAQFCASTGVVTRNE